MCEMYYTTKIERVNKLCELLSIVLVCNLPFFWWVTDVRTLDVPTPHTPPHGPFCHYVLLL